MPTVNVKIQPAIINWALSQTSEELLGEKLVENIRHWIDGTKSPTFHQIEDFSKKSHIPLGYFFLRTPPAEQVGLLEYRTLDSANEMLYPEMVCNVKITVKNSNSKDEPDKGIDFLNYALYGKDFQLQLSELLYYVANPDMEDGLLSFRLMPGTEKEFYLPFSFRPSADVEPIQTVEVRNSRLYLPVCLYPEQRQIVLEGIDR